jgi:multiple sugar transport system permease protein
MATAVRTPTKQNSRERSDANTGWLMSLPAVIVLGVFLVIPFIMAFVLSFTDQRLVPNPNLPTEFVGARNYVRMWEDAELRRAFLNNFTFVLFVVPIQTALALGMAILVNRKLPGINFFRTIYFIPVATVMVVVAIIWNLLYNPGAGLINAFLSFISFGQLGPYNWLSDPKLALPAIMLLSIWQGAGYQMLIFLAGLQSIPKEIYEAADIDGANPWQQFRSVTLPQLRNTTIFVVITTTIFAFQLFTQNYTMTKGGPVALDAIRTIVMKIVDEGFTQLRVGYASAISVIFFILVLAISLIQRRLLPEEREIK